MVFSYFISLRISKILHRKVPEFVGLTIRYLLSSYVCKHKSGVLIALKLTIVYFSVGILT